MGYTFTLSEIIPAPPAAIYDAWVNSRAHSAMTGSKATQSPRVGANVSAWDGYISGTNLELVPGKRIVQSWRTTKFTDADPELQDRDHAAAGRGRHAPHPASQQRAKRADELRGRRLAGELLHTDAGLFHQGRSASRAQVCRNQEANRQGQGGPRQGTGDPRQNGEPREGREARQGQRPQARQEPEPAAAQDAAASTAQVNRTALTSLRTRTGCGERSPLGCDYIPTRSFTVFTTSWHFELLAASSALASFNTSW